MNQDMNQENMNAVNSAETMNDQPQMIDPNAVMQQVSDTVATPANNDMNNQPVQPDAQMSQPAVDPYAVQTSMQAPVGAVDQNATQVLNMQDVQNSIQQDKGKSKLPILIALFGVVAIAVGVYFMLNTSTDSLTTTTNSSNNVEETPEVVTDDEEKTDDETAQNAQTNPDSLTCTYKEANGNLSYEYTEVYTFSETLLKSYEKALIVTKSETTEETTGEDTTTIQDVYETYNMPVRVTGYEYKVAVDEDYTKLSLDLSVDLELFPKENLSEGYAALDFTNIVYDYDETYDNVKSGLESVGYTCN